MSETVSLQEQKMAKAYTILSKGDRPSQLNDEAFTVPSQSGNWLYNVVKHDAEWHCDCPDHNKRNADCKHIYTVKFWMNLKSELKEEIPDYKPLNFHGCPKCNSYDVVKNGNLKTKMGKKTRFLCKNCKKSFVLEQEGFEGRKFDSELITCCLGLYFRGVSFRKVADHVKQAYGLDIVHTTILRWVEKYCKLVSEYVDTLNPEIGDTWHADEMAVLIRDGQYARGQSSKSKYVWLWNCMDADTRFLLANQVTVKRSSKEARKLFNKAKTVSNSYPKQVITDGLSAYNRGIRKELLPRKSGVKHIAGVGITDKIANNKVERLHGSIRQRVKVMRGMERVDTSDTLMNGYRVHYNFVRPHMALDMTPAEKAGINLNLGHNKWAGLIEKAVKSSTDNAPLSEVYQQ